MYTVAIPVTNWYPNREMDMQATLQELRRAGATRVWLCTARGIESEDILKAQLEALKVHRLFFEQNGIEVGVWLSSIGHGGALSHEDGPSMSKAAGYVRVVGLNGGESGDSFCPSCEPFATDYSEWIGRIAETGAKLIMIDDDYRLSLHGTKGPGCCCDRHMAEYRRRVGENVARSDLDRLIFTGKPSKYRDAWLDMGRDALIGLAKRIRERVDRVDPSTRVGVCAVMSTWDSDGVNAIDLTKALAGGTKPFLRTIGAPYWAARGQLAKSLNHIVELARVQRQWCEGAGVELFTEGDAYPRPRFNTPASYLEMYDMILRADGRFDGILKYMIDYVSSIHYETGYIDRMVRNAPVYDWIERHMANGRAVGADVVCPFDRLRTADLPNDMTGDEASADYFYPPASRMLVDSSLPVAYGTRGAHVACGEEAKALTDEMLGDGCVLDIGAALRLTERGVDVGLEAACEPTTQAGVEHFIDEDEYVSVGAVERFRRVTLKAGAEVLSTIGDAASCWRYENALGHRFVVYPFEMGKGVRTQSLMRSYARQRQLTDALVWVGKKPLPAVCLGHPDLYMMCKVTDEGLAVGLWNLSADYVMQPRLKLGRRWASVETFGCDAALEGDAISLQGEIAPYAFAGIVVKG